LVGGGRRGLREARSDGPIAPHVARADRQPVASGWLARSRTDSNSTPTETRASAESRARSLDNCPLEPCPAASGSLCKQWRGFVPSRLADALEWDVVQVGEAIQRRRGDASRLTTRTGDMGGDVSVGWCLAQPSTAAASQKRARHHPTDHHPHGSTRQRRYTARQAAAPRGRAPAPIRNQ
jgi:hypothetical protein